MTIFNSHFADRVGGSVAGEPKENPNQYWRDLANTPIQAQQTQTLEEPLLLARTAHVRKPNEQIIELIARCGISPTQIKEWDSVTISRFVVQSELNRRDEVTVTSTFS